MNIIRPFLISCVVVAVVLCLTYCTTTKQDESSTQATPPSGYVAIDSLMLTIDSCKQCVQLEQADTTVVGVETRGIVADIRNRNELIRLQVTDQGEMGRKATVFLVWGGSVYYQLHIVDQYDRPFYVPGMIVKSDTVIVNCSIHPEQCNDDLFVYAKAFFD